MGFSSIVQITIFKTITGEKMYILKQENLSTTFIETHTQTQNKKMYLLCFCLIISNQ
jgi:hypothetical protein